MVAWLLLLNGLKTEIGRRLGYAFIQARSPQRGINSLVDGIVLVIGGDFLHCFDGGESRLQVFLLLFLKNSERLNQIQQRLLVHHAVDQHFQFAHKV